MIELFDKIFRRRPKLNIQLTRKTIHIEDGVDRVYIKQYDGVSILLTKIFFQCMTVSERDAIASTNWVITISNIMRMKSINTQCRLQTAITKTLSNAGTLFKLEKVDGE